jgi:leucyl-tRNA synthetase
MKRYNPKDIEPKWQKIWADKQTFHVTEDPDKPKKYIIDMFPYPSGAAMHVGHVRNFTISDVLSQYHRQKGYNVMHTMGWDTFGLPAENYAIKTDTPPAETTKANIANFKQQLQRLGMSYDWSREINTTDPEYYRWTQWIFTQLFEKGLAYQKESAQWWCPVDKTVLANEQVENGKCWRCGNEVVKKNLKQWFFKITEYADQLLDSIDDLDWPEKIKTMQRNWIGRSEGMSIRFKLDGLGADNEEIEVFTTAHDTIYGVTFMVFAPEHPLITKYATYADNWLEVEEYINKAARKSEFDREVEKKKTGVAIEGLYAVNPIDGQKIPVWIADYVLLSYGTGIVMAVPGEDERDYEFANKYSLPIVYTTEQQEFVNYQTELKRNRKNYKLSNSGEFDGLDFEVGRQKIQEKIQKSGVGDTIVQYKMRDWLISRQRYWGAPIPIIYCDKDGAVAVPEDQLPVKLPEVKSYEPTGEGSVLASVDDWVNTKCPKCGSPAKRETDTMDGYACSSWYFLRYTDPKNDKQAWDPAKASYWLPIDYYCGGDHAVSHLLYSRFWMYFFADQGWIEKTRREPVGKLVYNGYILAEDGTKMSKSKGNVVNPDDMIDQGYGADAVRVFEMFIAPYDQNTNWNTNGVPGAYRFLNRLWTLTQEYLEAEDRNSSNDEELLRISHKAIKKVSDDLQNLSFNTAIAALMETVNDLFKLKAAKGYSAKEWEFTLKTLVQLTAPFAPHITEELWADLGGEGSVHVSPWPVHDDKYLTSDTLTIVVQVNGKVRANIQVPADASEEDTVKAARSDENVKAHLEKGVKKTIYVPKKLVNFVV